MTLPPRADDIAITGVGILTPLGDTLALVAAALNAGRCAVAPVSEPMVPGLSESRLADFDATRYANVRGMRVYNRTTRLGISAGKLALLDAGISGPEVMPSDALGLVMASTFGHLDTLVEYDRSLVAEGIQRTNPALMPLGLPSAPAAAIGLSFGAKAFAITLANDAVSSLDALALAGRLLLDGRARACLVVGAFAPFAELSLAAARAGLLAPAGAFRVFDRRHCGTAFGEAAGAMVLERRDHAEKRGAAPRGFIRGQASTFAAGDEALSGALQRASDKALRASGVDAAQLALVSAGGGGVPVRDVAEAQSLRETLVRAAPTTPVMAVKAHLGEPLDAGGLIQGLLALAALGAGEVPAIPDLGEPAVDGLHYAGAGGVGSPGSGGGGRHALVTSIASTGSCAALILSGTDGN